MEKEIIIDNKLEEVSRVAQFLEELGVSLQLPSEVMMSIDLAIEEAVTNIIRHAYPTGKEGEIILRVHIASGVLTFLVIDDGISFDPRNKETPEASLPLEQRLSKGLGLFIIRRTMDEVDYRTEGNQNLLTLVKRIDMTFEPETTMRTNLCKIDGVTILSIQGRLDTSNAQDFNVVIKPLLTDTTPDVIINCEGMSYISSSGLRSLIALQKSVLQHEGTLAIEAMKPEIRKIFDMTGCSSFFTIR